MDDEGEIYLLTSDELADIRARLQMRERPRGPEAFCTAEFQKSREEDLKRDKKATENATMRTAKPIGETKECMGEPSRCSQSVRIEASRRLL